MEPFFFIILAEKVFGDNHEKLFIYFLNRKFWLKPT